MFKFIYLIALFCIRIQNKLNLSTGKESCEYIVQFNTKYTDGQLNHGITNLELWWNRDIFDGGKIKEKFFDLENLSYQNDCYSTQYGNQTQRDQGQTFTVSFKERDGNQILNFITQAQLDNTLSLNESIEQLLELIQKPGLYGQFAYTTNGQYNIYLPIKEGQTPIKINTIKLNEIGKESLTCQTSDSVSVKWFNCLPRDVQLSNYFENSLPRNWAFWLFIFILMSFFMITVFQDEQMQVYYHKEEVWTHHAVYSIRNQISGMFWKRQRMAILYIELCVITLVLALFTIWFKDVHISIRILLFPFIAYFISLIFSLIAGLLLRAYQNTYRTYIEETQLLYNTTDDKKKIERIDKFNRTNYRTILQFYTYCAVCAITSNVISILVMRQQSWNDMGWWILSITIGMLYNLCVFNTLYVLMAKNNQSMHKLLIHRGFYYERDLQENYLVYFKNDYQIKFN